MQVRIKWSDLPRDRVIKFLCVNFHAAKPIKHGRAWFVELPRCFIIDEKMNKEITFVFPISVFKQMVSFSDWKTNSLNVEILISKTKFGRLGRYWYKKFEGDKNDTSSENRN
jgi:hypothetical protein